VFRQTSVSRINFRDFLTYVIWVFPRRLSAGRISERSELRNTIHVDPFPIKKEGSSSPPLFYGTQLSTILLIRRDGQVLFIERDLWRQEDGGKLIKGDPSMQRVFRFQLDSPRSTS